jgi:hypothetical protein
MTTINTYPSPLVQNQPGILTYSNPSVFAAPNDSYILKNVLGSTVSDPFVYSPTLPLISTTFASADGSGNPFPGTLSGLAFDTSGNLYVNTNGYPSIYKITPTGAVSTFATISGSFDNLFLVFDTSGNLYVTNGNDNTIYIIDPTGTTINPFNTSITNPFAIAFNNGFLYVSSGTINSIYKINSAGAIVQTFTSGLFSVPSGLAFDSNNNLYVANSGFSNIVKLDPTTGVVSPFNSASIINNPHGLAFDTYNNLYVANLGNNNILQIDPTGTNCVIFSANNFNQPWALAFDTFGNLFVSNLLPLNNGIISKITTTIDTFTFPNVLIRTSGLNHLYLYDVTTGQLIASDIIIEISAICFKEGTKILCFIDKKEKYIPIEDIKEDTFVKIYKKNGKFEDQYKRAKTIIKGSILNAREHTMHKLYKLSKSKNPALIADLYVTGSHALLYDNLSNEEFEKMDELIERYNNYNIKFRDEDEYDEEYINDIKNMIKYYNDYKITLEDKYKLIAYFNTDFEEVTDNSICNIYHIVLENENKYENYGIYANGILAESTCEVSLTRFPGYEKINESNTVNNGIKKGFDINDKLNKYLIKQGQQDKKITKQLIEHIEKIEDTVVKQIDTNTNTNTNIRKNYTYRKIPIKKNMTYKNKMSQK